ncbi:FadR/GntR family transcriptional regulator [Gordonia humi]|uniref:DNA-binding FadR family transcriptional regulator n=1 Tax=Gordonia humi TaxID=686429 RepID=A0A840F1R1_9ACTN|nr:FCD domain-containing protein [Gordonia humi]MBB4134270.1 DNA-binding FadR family transcriptional regulator [Gordonia humi]
MTQNTGGRGLPIIYHPDNPIYTADKTSDAKRQPKASEVTAASIVSDIVRLGLKVGDRLPAEVDMLAQYPVSRETLREALRILEVQGMIALKRGPGGGPFVSALNASYLARTATLYFHLSGATYDEVFDTWETIEPQLTAKVARISDKHLKERAFARFLGYQIDEHDETEVFSDLNNFHAVIAELSGNRVLTLITQAITHIVVEHVLNADEPVTQQSHLNDEHIDIAQAIIAGRPRKASTLMQEHIADVVENYRSRYPDRSSELVQWR